MFPMQRSEVIEWVSIFITPILFVFPGIAAVHKQNTMTLVDCYSWCLVFLCLASIFCHTTTFSQSCPTNDEQCWQNTKNKYTVQEFTDEELFTRGHLKPFGSHRPPDEIVEELPFMISPQDFYMNYVVKHKPVVIKGW